MAFTKRPTDDSDSVHSYIHMINLIEIFLIIGGIATLILLFIIKPDFSESQKEKSKLIGVTYMTMNNDFYEIVNEQISHRIEAQGDRVVLRDPAMDASRQQTQIEEMLEMGIDALVLTPVNAASLTDTLRKAKNLGIKIVVVDTELEDPLIADATIISDNYGAGQIIGNYHLMNHPNGSKVVVMTHEEAISGRERVKGFIDTIKKDEKTEIVGELPCEGQYDLAMLNLGKFIESGKEFDGVFCLNDFSASGAASALEENDMLGIVELYGVDASPSAKRLISEGKMTASAAQFPTRLGTKAADALYDLLEKNPTERHVIVPIQLVTSRNISIFTKDRWQ